MIGRSFLAAALLLSMSAPAAAQTQSEQERLGQIRERGRQLYEVDRAARVTTDDIARRDRNWKSWPLKGWIVERDGSEPNSYAVTYYGEGEGGPRAWYVGKVRGGRLASAELLPADSRPLLTEPQLRLARIRDIASGTEYRPCTRGQFNVAAIPPASSNDPIDVYLLTPQVKANEFPFGGHYLLRVGPDGAIQSKRAFTRACINMPKTGGRKGGTGAFFVTHLLDPTPTEIHVFMSISAGAPVIVAAGEPMRMWVVDGDREAGEMRMPPPSN